MMRMLKSKEPRVLPTVLLVIASLGCIALDVHINKLTEQVVQPEGYETEVTVAETTSDLQHTIAKTLSTTYEETAALPTTEPVIAALVSNEPVTKDDVVKDAEETEVKFKFPDFISDGAKAYLEEAYNQAYEVCKDTVFPDPFMALSLSVVEMPVKNHEVFRIPLVYQDTLDKALKKSGGDYSAAIPYSKVSTRSYKKYACVGPLQMAPGWVSCEPRNPTLWKESCQMFYEDAELAIPGMTAFAEKCGIEVNDRLLRTLAAMRHNVGHLSDWAKSNPDSRTGKKFIPFKSKRAVYEWNAAVASDIAQEAIKKAAYEAYLEYLETGIYENQGIGWREIATITGYPKSNVTSEKQWWRPLYSVRFWFNYYQLRLLFGVDTAETLGIK